MPQQTKTEALEELARLIRRDIMNGTARLNETWWFDDDTKMQDRIAHVLLDYSDEEKPTEIDVAGYNAEIDRLNEKCAALVVERNSIAAENAGLHKHCNQLLIDMGRDAVPLRIDPDMSDPQPGKLLVVQVNLDDCVTMPANWINEKKKQEWVGFLVETPAVEVKRTPKVGNKVRIIDGANAGEAAAVRAIDSIDPDCFCLMLADGERWFAHVDNLEVIE